MKPAPNDDPPVGNGYELDLIAHGFIMLPDGIWYDPNADEFIEDAEAFDAAVERGLIEEDEAYALIFERRRPLRMRLGCGKRRKNGKKNGKTKGILKCHDYLLSTLRSRCMLRRNNCQPF